MSTASKTLINSPGLSFDEIYANFRWQVPPRLNIGDALCSGHAGDALAIKCYNDKGGESLLTFGQLRSQANRLAHYLQHLGVERGDRVALIVPQRTEVPIIHVGCYRAGAVVVPLSHLFGPEACEYRLRDSGTKILLTTAAARDKLAAELADLPELEKVIPIDHPSFAQNLGRASDQFDSIATRSSDPAVLIYTSGTTGPPKGALKPHSILYGNMTGFELSQNFFPTAAAVFWTPADWSWTGGLWDGLLPALYHGCPVIGSDCGKFDPDFAFDLLARDRVTHSFLPPTAMKMMRAQVRERKPDLHLLAIMSAGEPVGPELLNWSREALGAETNQMYGQTEHNYMVGDSCCLPTRPGALGKAYPGHRMAVIDDEGNPVKDGETGELAAHRDDPVHFLGYWKQEQKTREKYAGDYFRTGDLGYSDEDGYLWFVGRKDDVISSAGYRIGPGEIEEQLMRHPSIQQAAVIGVPDPDGLRGEVIKAYLVTRSGIAGSDRLKKEIQSQVRDHLAAFEYPRQIEFIDELPLTTSGKVRRQELRERNRKQTND